MNAKTALELGAPIRGILAFTSTSTLVFSRTSGLISNAEYVSLATRPDAQFLHLVVELLQLLDKFHPNTHFRFLTLLIAPVNSRSVAVRSLSGCLMKKPNSNKRFSIGGTRMRRLTTNIPLAAFQILSMKPTSRRKMLLPCTACWKVTIHALPLFEELLLFGALRLMTSVSFPFMGPVLLPMSVTKIRESSG